MSQLLDSMTATFANCLDIVRKKNHDYASEDHEYRNFEGAIRLGLTVQQSIMLRLQDKISRIENLMTKEAYVTAESLDDSVDDAINYLGILKARRQFESSPQESSTLINGHAVKVYSVSL